MPSAGPARVFYNMTPTTYRPCTRSGCPTLVEGGGYCIEHGREERAGRDAARGTFQERGYDALYRRNRARVLREEVLCVVCRKTVNKSLKFPDPWSATAGHIVPRSRGGSNERGNLQLEHLHCNSSRQAR
jgi:5-methylcytosine-specific restriction endonuclease McrA